jgi:hypothetical protein
VYQPLNGWTKTTILRAIREGMQDRPSYDSQMGTCAYRAPDGSRCAVGVFIPDDLYAASCEHKGVDKLLEVYPGLEASMPLALGALRTMQGIHDMACSASDPRPELIAWVQTNVAEA